MPHINIKLLEGRDKAQLEELSAAMTAAMQKVLGCDDKYISLSMEEYSKQEWQTVFAQEIHDKSATLVKAPGYDPKSLL